MGRLDHLTPRFDSESKSFLRLFLTSLSVAGFTADQASALIADPQAMAEWVDVATRYLEDARLRRAAETAQHDRDRAELVDFRMRLADLNFSEWTAVGLLEMSELLRVKLAEVGATTLRELVGLTDMPHGIAEIEGADKTLCQLLDAAQMDYPAWLVEKPRKA